MLGIHHSKSLPLLAKKLRPGARAAINAALSGVVRSFCHGACITQGKKVLSTGRNVNYKTHPEGSGMFKSMHAETSAIANLKNDVEDTICFVVRVNNNGLLRSSRPCSDCLELIKQYGVKLVVFTTDSGWSIEAL